MVSVMAGEIGAGCGVVGAWAKATAANDINVRTKAATTRMVISQSVDIT
jgi:hypothetical protein